MNRTGIGWTELTWNPATGCQRITPGCAFCYAYSLAENKRGTVSFPVGFDLQLRPHKLRDPLRLKEPALIFVNSMSDLFWEAISDEYRDRVLDVIDQTPQHQYQVLTKRPDVLLRYSRRRRLPVNFWAGVTIESQDYADRTALLRQVDVPVRFLSCEPLLSPVSLDLSGVAWVIGGGESGIHLFRSRLCEVRGLVAYDAVTKSWRPRADRYQWARSLRDQTKAAGAAFFWKQWGGRMPASAGRVLDGRTWEEYPQVTGQQSLL